MSKLVLGTVQFGLNYGINNTSGQVSDAEVKAILKLASVEKVGTLDTSSAYGSSEVVLGKALASTRTEFNIVSKYPKSDKGVRETFKQSIKNLGVNHLYAYLIHHFDFFKEKPSIWDEFKSLKTDGLVSKIGFSLYNVEQLEYLLNKGVRFDILQFPYNIFDRQFEKYLPILKQSGVEIHTRSAFLQGLFFKDISKLPICLQPLKKYLLGLHKYCSSRGILIEELALKYVICNANIDGVLIGVDNSQQLESNINVSNKMLSASDVDFVNSIRVEELDLLSPVNWH